MVPADLVRIDVDVDDLLVGLRHREGEAGADGEDEVGLEQVIAYGRVGPDGGTERQVRVVAGRALAFGARDHAGLEIFGQRGERLAGSAVHRASARVDDGPLGRDEQLHRAAHVARGGGRAQGTRRVDQHRLAFLLHGLGRHLDLDRTRPAGGELVHGRAHRRRHIGHFQHPAPPLGHRPDALDDLILRHLAGDHEDGRGGGVRGAEPGRSIEKPRSRHHQGGADAAARAGVAVRHVGGGLLVPRLDEANPRLLAERGHRAIELDAGEPEDHANAFVIELLDECFAAGHPGHGDLPSVEVMRRLPPPLPESLSRPEAPAPHGVAMAPAVRSASTRAGE